MGVTGGRAVVRSAATLGGFEDELRKGMKAMAQLVFAFYTPSFSFAGFLEKNPDCQGELVDLLMGNVFRRPVDRLMAALAGEMAS